MTYSLCSVLFQIKGPFVVAQRIARRRTGSPINSTLKNYRKPQSLLHSSVSSVPDAHSVPHPSAALPPIPPPPSCPHSQVSPFSSEPQLSMESRQSSQPAILQPHKPHSSSQHSLLEKMKPSVPPPQVLVSPPQQLEASVSTTNPSNAAA